MRKALDLVGVRKGMLTVVRSLGNSKHGHLWECKCDCGRVVARRAARLKPCSPGYSCGCSQYTSPNKTGVKRVIDNKTKLPEGEAAFNQLVSLYRRQAAKRKHVWNLTNDEARALFESDCHYCGVEPSQRVRGKGYNGEYVYNGIDRKDSSLGYVSHNCVACCVRCNRAKSTSTYDEFVGWLTRLALYRSAL